MKYSVKQLFKDFATSKSLVFTFLRSGISAQVCGLIDFIVSFVMFAWIGFKPIYATAIGALVGGICNAIVNFKFTYKDDESPWKAVAVKFTMVWIGSALLNSFGTEAIYWVLNQWHWLEKIGFKPDGYFTVARLSMSGIVSLCWNFLLQRNFVYHCVPFDKTAVKIFDFIFFRRHRRHEK